MARHTDTEYSEAQLIAEWEEIERKRLERSLARDRALGSRFLLTKLFILDPRKQPELHTREHYVGHYSEPQDQ